MNTPKELLDEIIIRCRIVSETPDDDDPAYFLANSILDLCKEYIDEYA